MAHEPIDHPDLADVGRTLQRRFDRILEAEQEAAAVLARRTATLRDRLLDIEDQHGHVSVTTLMGLVTAGVVDAVAADHIELRHDKVSTLVALDQVAIVVFG